VKKVVLLLLIIIPILALSTCGNGLLDPGSTKETDPVGTTPSVVPGTVVEDVPKGIAPIYIDTDEQLYQLTNMGADTNYPRNGYYILRGNGVVEQEKLSNGTTVERRIFHAKTKIGISGQPFQGTITGWYKDETTKTTIILESNMANGLMYQILGGSASAKAKIIWLLIETASPINAPTNGKLGIIALEANNAIFDNVTVNGSIAVTPGTDPVVQLGGFVGLAGAGVEFKNIIAGGGIDIIQPDLSHAGGILEVKKIAAMAEAYDVAIAPHCPLGPIALAACLQLDFCTHNAFIQEQSLGLHYHKDNTGMGYLNDATPFEIHDGYLHRTNRPGLGIDVNEAAVRQAAQKPHQTLNPTWRNEDGSLSEW
jgi:hypothetical protein